MIRRYISVLVRRNKSRKAHKKLIRFVEKVISEIAGIPACPVQSNTLMLVRMDEIGDYILCRNLFPFIKKSDKFRNHKIIYVGNVVCKNLAETMDASYIDSFFWVDKEKFKEDVSYRFKLFTNLRKIAPFTVIELERTPDVNYGDLIVHATNAPVRYGSANYYEKDLLNQLSNSFYSNIFKRNWDLTHEFIFNQAYINWICGSSIDLEKPTIEVDKLPEFSFEGKYIICVIGSSKRSKNWPIDHWVLLLRQLAKIFDGKFILIGGEREKSLSEKIIQREISPNIISMVGKTTLMEAFAWVKNADLMISNDTFAIHASVAMGNTPTVVVANGESAFRFSELSTYSSQYRILYTKPYCKKKDGMQPKAQWFFSVPSIDMATITVEDVFDNCKELLENNKRPKTEIIKTKERRLV